MAKKDRIRLIERELYQANEILHKVLMALDHASAPHTNILRKVPRVMINATDS